MMMFFIIEQRGQYFPITDVPLYHASTNFATIVARSQPAQISGESAASLFAKLCWK